MEKLKLFAVRFLALAYLFWSLLFSVVLLTASSLIFIPFFTLTLLLIPKIRGMALNIPVVKALAAKSALIYTLSIALTIISLGTMPESSQQPTLAEVPVSQDSDTPENSAKEEITTKRSEDDSANEVRILSGAVELVVECGTNQTESMRVYLFGPKYDDRLQVLVPRINHFGSFESEKDSMQGLLVPIRNGESQPNDIFTVTVSKEPERYDLGGYPIGGFIDDHYDHFEVPDFHLARDGSKLTPFVASLLLNDNRVADPATFSSETRSGEFLNC